VNNLPPNNTNNEESEEVRKRQAGKALLKVISENILKTTGKGSAEGANTTSNGNI
jgi:hypothetical protein